MPKKPRVAIAIPLASPMIYWQTVAAILEMEKPRGSELMVFQGALVDRARNHLVEQMLSHANQFTHLFFLDADIAPRPDALAQLLSRNLPIVSGLYRKRTPPHEPMAFIKAKKGFIPISERGPALQEVDRVGGGCLLIRRDVFRKMKPPWFVNGWTKKGHVSEDFYFCDKAHACGYKIFLDRETRPLHLQPVGIGTSPEGKMIYEPF
ncbi:MAG: hypothetical protein HYT76_01825 [Deltaproteobacteria bacterium]|nr:hypothetical protein [Deltaproteobacteria bacterium]